MERVSFSHAVPDLFNDCAPVGSRELIWGQVVIQLVLSLPSSRRKLKEEMGKLREQFRAKIDPSSYPKGVVLRSSKVLPEQGRSREWLEEEWKGLKGIETGDAVEGRVSGTVYHVSGISPSP